MGEASELQWKPENITFYGSGKMKIARRQLRRIIREELVRSLEERCKKRAPYSEEPYDHQPWEIGGYSGTVTVLAPDEPISQDGYRVGLKGAGEWNFGEPQWLLSFSVHNQGFLPFVISEEMAHEFCDDPTGAVQKYWQTLNHATGHKMGEHGAEPPESSGRRRR